jgi:transcriptional regulator with XRE-family HTH domain
MSELVDKLRPEFQDKEYRDAYAEECLNTMIATQIKVLREQRKMTQGQVAEATGMMQPRVAVLEDSSYENWSVNTLKRFARAFDVALSVKFETFSTLVEDFEGLSRESLQRPAFIADLRFKSRRPQTPRRFKRRERFHARRLISRTSTSPFPPTAQELAGASEVKDTNCLAQKKGPVRVEIAGLTVHNSAAAASSRS